MIPSTVAVGLVWFLAFLFSTTVHEAMHAFVAWRGGDPTAYQGGQVSLSPIPHIRREPIGMLVLPLLTALTQGWVIGWASAPYDPSWAARHPRRAALMAAAGPAGNLIIAIAAFAALRAGLAWGYFAAPDAVRLDSIVELASGGTSLLTVLLSVLLVLNVFLFAFNLLPLPPLDGAAVFGIFVPASLRDRARDASAAVPMSLIGMLVAWRLFPFISDPLFSLILRLVHPDAQYGS